MEELYFDYLVSLANNCSKKDEIYQITITNKNDSLFYTYYCGKYSISYDKQYGDITSVILGPYDEVKIDFSSSLPKVSFDFRNQKHHVLDFGNSIIYSNLGKKVDDMTIVGADYNTIVTDILDVKTSTVSSVSSPGSSIDFPITKEEFYVVPFLLGLLIFLLFFRWLYPNKGGKEI